MPVDIAESYYLGITVLEAQEMLIDMKTAQYPHLKREDQQKIHRQLHQMAYPRIYDAEEKATTLAEFGKKLAAQLGGDA